MPGLLKLSICVVMKVLARRQTRRRDALGEPARRGVPLVEPLIETVKGVAHPVARQRVHVAGLGLFQEAGNVAGGEGVMAQA